MHLAEILRAFCLWVCTRLLNITVQVHVCVIWCLVARLLLTVKWTKLKLLNNFFIWKFVCQVRRHNYPCATMYSTPSSLQRQCVVASLLALFKAPTNRKDGSLLPLYGMIFVFDRYGETIWVFPHPWRNQNCCKHYFRAVSHLLVHLC